MASVDQVFSFFRAGAYDEAREEMRKIDTAKLWTLRRDGARMVEMITDEIQGRWDTEHMPSLFSEQSFPTEGRPWSPEYGYADLAKEKTWKTGEVLDQGPEPSSVGYSWGPDYGYFSPRSPDGEVK